MNFQNLVERLYEMFLNTHKNEVEEFIESKNPKSPADVEHWIQQWTYHNDKKWFPDA
jgi:hypothetical protein